mgnify:CR=1 FL=1
MRIKKEGTDVIVGSFFQVFHFLPPNKTIRNERPNKESNPKNKFLINSKPRNTIPLSRLNLLNFLIISPPFNLIIFACLKLPLFLDTS